MHLKRLTWRDRVCFPALYKAILQNDSKWMSVNSVQSGKMQSNLCVFKVFLEWLFLRSVTPCMCHMDSEPVNLIVCGTWKPSLALFHLLLAGPNRIVFGTHTHSSFCECASVLPRFIACLWNWISLVKCLILKTLRITITKAYQFLRVGRVWSRRFLLNLVRVLSYGWVRCVCELCHGLWTCVFN